jgi:hypothetical protein
MGEQTPRLREVLKRLAGSVRDSNPVVAAA